MNRQQRLRSALNLLQLAVTSQEPKACAIYQEQYLAAMKHMKKAHAG